MQDMLTSAKPVSVLYLQGDPEDDPDLYPVKLPGREQLDANEITRTETWESNPSIGSPPPTVVP